jgi:hypothetical protein
MKLIYQGMINLNRYQLFHIIFILKLISGKTDAAEDIVNIIVTY